jgi:hypothetical protein
MLGYLYLQVTDNEMLVDEYEQYHNDRTDDVVVSRSGSEEPEPEPLADDCKDITILYPTYLLKIYGLKMAVRRYENPRRGVGSFIRQHLMSKIHSPVLWSTV